MKLQEIHEEVPLQVSLLLKLMAAGKEVRLVDPIKSSHPLLIEKAEWLGGIDGLKLRVVVPGVDYVQHVNYPTYMFGATPRFKLHRAEGKVWHLAILGDPFKK